MEQFKVYESFNNSTLLIPIADFYAFEVAGVQIAWFEKNIRSK